MGSITFDSPGLTGNLTLGTEAQVPYINAAGNDFNYSNGLRYDGSSFFTDQWEIDRDLTPTSSGAQVRAGSNGSFRFGLSIALLKSSNIGHSLVGDSTGTSASIEYADADNSFTRTLGMFMNHRGGVRINYPYETSETATKDNTLKIRGFGTTSSTTSFLVQNSASTDLLNVRDDASVIFGNTYKLEYTSAISSTLIAATPVNALTVGCSNSHVSFTQGSVIQFISNGNGVMRLFPSTQNCAFIGGSTNPTETLEVGGAKGSLKVNGSKVNFPNLPTSSAGLVAGDLWNNAGVVNII